MHQVRMEEMSAATCDDGARKFGDDVVEKIKQRCIEGCLGLTCHNHMF